MDTLSLLPAIQPEPSLTEPGQAALRDEVLRHLGTLPFCPTSRISRSLWLFFVCPQGIRTQAAVPVDDRLDLPDRENIVGACEFVAGCMEHSMLGETAIVALRRPGKATISDADDYIFRAMSMAAAHRDTAPWAFNVTGPDGVRAR
jgi:hypothetical protein